MKYALRSLLAITIGLTASCSESNPEGQIKIFAPEASEAQVALSANVDWKELSNQDFARRVVVDEVVVNIDELRLLGDNPTMRVDGEPLIDKGFLLSISNNNPAVTIPFSEQFLSDYLSVYARIEPTESLSNSSVVVRARLYKSPGNKFEQSLSSSQDDEDDTPCEHEVNTNYETHETPNPDSEPNREETPNPDSEPNREETPNPDGEPNREETPNPDGEPNNEDDEDVIRRSGLTQRTTEGFPNDAFINFELRGSDLIELVALFEPNARREVILAIPAHKWMTNAVMKRLEAALILSLEGSTDRKSNALRGRQSSLIIVDANDKSSHQISDDRTNVLRRHEDYRLLTEGLIDPKKPRRP